jgi:hypothetical protein
MEERPLQWPSIQSSSKARLTSFSVDVNIRKQAPPWPRGGRARDVGGVGTMCFASFGFRIDPVRSWREHGDGRGGRRVADKG